MADQQNPTVVPWLVRERYESCPFFARASAVVKRWLLRPWKRVEPNKPVRAVFTKRTNLWPCGTKDKPLELSYSYFKLGGNIVQSNRELKVNYAIELVEKKVPGVKFVYKDEVRDAVIRIAFDDNHPDGETWSQVGRDAARVDSGEPTMNLSEVSGHESGEIQEGSNEYGDIVHELFHTLGMLHEHQHPERKFTISRKAVVQSMKSKGWSEGDIDDNIVRKLRPNEIGAYSPDNASIMMYSIRPEWTKDGSEFKRSDKPSDLDWAWLNLMYPPREQTQFEQALSKCGINLGKERREIILKLYLDGEWEGVRSELTRVSNPKSLSKIVGRLRL